jgi:hypothetical protein
MDSRPNAKEVAGRLLSLRGVLTRALAAPPRNQLANWMAHWTEAERERFAKESESRSRTFWNTVKSSPVARYLSPWEQEFAETTILIMSSQQHTDALWRMEAARVLMWALCLLPDLPALDTPADLGFLKFESLSQPANFLGAAILRSQFEIAHARDLAELWHWRSRTEEFIREERPFPSDDQNLVDQGLRSYRDIVHRVAIAAHERGDIFLIHEDFAVKGKSYAELSPEEWSELRSISFERHRTLNWICGYSDDNDWDTTPTDT